MADVLFSFNNNNKSMRLSKFLMLLKSCLSEKEGKSWPQLSNWSTINRCLGRGGISDWHPGFMSVGSFFLYSTNSLARS